jgi:hypothetical protein
MAVEYMESAQSAIDRSGKWRLMLFLNGYLVLLQRVTKLLRHVDAFMRHSALTDDCVSVILNCYFTSCQRIL